MTSPIVVELGLAPESLDDALRLVERAHALGAQAIKAQLHLAAEMSEAHPWRSTVLGRALSTDALERVRDHARARGMRFLVTAYCEAALREAIALEPDALKIGSGELSHRPLVAAAVASGRPLVVSLGLHSRREAQAVVCELDAAARQLTLLACVSRYPETPADGALAAMRWWARQGHRAPVGVSLHAPEPCLALLALGAGAAMVEVHWPRQGPDAPSSLDDAGLEVVCRTAAARAELAERERAPDEELARIARHDRDPRWRRLP